MTWRTCTKCGVGFTAGPTGGRPRTRCDACRTNHAKADGTAWRAMRRRVLAEEPICCVVGCGRPSTQVDHVIPLKLLPELALERSNLRGICARHNAQKGARVPGMLERSSFTPETGTAARSEPCPTCGYHQRHLCL